MPAAPKYTNNEAEAAGEEAPAAEAERRVVVDVPFHAYIHSQLVAFKAGQVLDKNVADYLLARNEPRIHAE